MEDNNDYDLLAKQIRQMKPTDKIWEFLQKTIRTMKRESPIYKLLRDELSILGYWKRKPRGNPRAGFIKGMGKVKKGGKYGT